MAGVRSGNVSHSASEGVGSFQWEMVPSVRKPEKRVHFEDDWLSCDPVSEHHDNKVACTVLTYAASKPAPTPLEIRSEHKSPLLAPMKPSATIIVKSVSRRFL